MKKKIVKPLLFNASRLARKEISKCLSDNYNLLDKEDLEEIYNFVKGLYQGA